MNLYEINNAILRILSENVDENGEITEKGLETLSALQMEKEQKIENVVLWIKDLKSENSAIKTEIDGFKARLKSNESKITTLEKWLIEATEGRKFSTAKCMVSFRTSTAIEITNINEIPEAFVRQRAEITPDKAKIKAVLQSGGFIRGAKLESRKSVIIK